MLWASLLIGQARAADLDGSLGVSSDNVFRGLTQSRGQASVQVEGYLTATHWFGGLAVESVRRPRDGSAGAEAIGYLGYQQLLSEDWRGALSLRHYDYPGNARRSRYAYDELSAAVSWRQRVTLELIGSPDTYTAAGNDRYGRDSAFAIELTGRQPLPYGLAADLGIGFYDLHEQIGAGYTYWSAGIGRQWRSWQAGLRYIGTDAQARHLFRYAAGDRLVVSAAWFF